MSKDTIEKKLDLVIYLLETMPERMMKALKVSEDARRLEKQKEIQEQMDFLKDHNVQINKMMYGYEAPKMDDNSGRI